MHTVFVNDKPFRFVNANDAEEWKGNTQSIFVAEKEMTIEDALYELEESPSHPGFIYLASNPDISWQILCSYCILIEAAGGLVKNENNEYLIIFRKGKFDLPKGKMEYDETPESCAIREVEEECGVSGLSITAPMDNTFHTYLLKRKRMLKKTHWFRMETTAQKLIPQLEENIEKAEWMSPEQIQRSVLKNTYSAIKEILVTGLEIET